MVAVGIVLLIITAPVPTIKGIGFEIPSNGINSIFPTPLNIKPLNVNTILVVAIGVFVAVGVYDSNTVLVVKL